MNPSVLLRLLEPNSRKSPGMAIFWKKEILIVPSTSFFWEDFNLFSLPASSLKVQHFCIFNCRLKTLLLWSHPNLRLKKWKWRKKEARNYPILYYVVCYNYASLWNLSNKKWMTGLIFDWFGFICSNCWFYWLT